MRSDLLSQVFYAGVILFSICFIGTLVKLGPLVLIVSHFLPGLCLGFILTQRITIDAPVNHKILFVIASTCIHLACVFFVDVAREHHTWTPLKLIIASSVGFLFLTIIHDWLFKMRITLVGTFLFPISLGFAAAILSALCMFYLHSVSFEQTFLENILWAGIFIIFPLWYWLFAWNIKRKHVATAAANNS